MVVGILGSPDTSVSRYRTVVMSSPRSVLGRFLMTGSAVWLRSGVWPLTSERCGGGM
jgi:hypothetical protein